MSEVTSIAGSVDVSAEKRRAYIKLAISVVMIAAVAIAWALATQFSKSALTVDPEHFNAPYSMMWFGTNFMTLCYPVFLIFEVGIRRRPLKEAHRSATSIFRGSRFPFAIKVFVTVAPFVVFWTGANYPYSVALTKISASIATSISSCNSAIVYLLSILILGDRLVPMKVLAIVFAIAGVAVISAGADFKAQWLGILLAVVSATCAAIYKVCFKKIVGAATLPQVSIFMSVLGFLNLTLNWIPPVILALTGAELVDFNYIPWGPMIASAMLSLLFNFLINFGIALLNPLVISVGMLMGIPLNAAIDVLFRGEKATGFFLGGTGLICISFLLIIFPYELVCQRRGVVAPENETSSDDYSDDKEESFYEKM